MELTGEKQRTDGCPIGLPELHKNHMDSESMGKVRGDKRQETRDKRQT
jgi:hypothetical protein